VRHPNPGRIPWTYTLGEENRIGLPFSDLENLQPGPNGEEMTVVGETEYVFQTGETSRPSSCRAQPRRGSSRSRTTDGPSREPRGLFSRALSTATREAPVTRRPIQRPKLPAGRRWSSSSGSSRPLN